MFDFGTALFRFRKRDLGVEPSCRLTRFLLEKKAKERHLDLLRDEARRPAYMVLKQRDTLGSILRSAIVKEAKQRDFATYWISNPVMEGNWSGCKDRKRV